MALQPNQRLGPYEILAAVGAGGMGEVYRARDTRLDRTVAIKVLPAHLADKPELRERFEREARTIASLNHPHICTLYDIGRQDRTDYLVLEYLEGETLAERLKKGPLPIEQVLKYAIEIADALDKAHRKGITHRDLKPGNIMLTKSGTKLLDFGLAKLRQEAAPTTPLSQLPTMKSAVTVEGTILGTLQYMAPEQIEGKVDDINGRTDIFALGTIVYEMATGKKAFEGKTQVSLIAKILETEPAPMSSLQPMTPPALDHVVKKCLAKEPEKRWQAASDLRDELRWIAEGSGQAAAPTHTVRKAGGSRHTIVVSAAISLIAVLITVIGIWNLSRAPSAPASVTRSLFSLPAGDRLVGSLALSPDGSRLVYAARRGNIQQLFLHPMDSFETRPIPGTEGADAPIFSPDSQWIGFVADGKLKKVSIGGGASVTLTPLGLFGGNGALGAVRTATWGTDGTIVFGSIALSRIPAAGGIPQELIIPDAKRGEISVQWPAFLPDTKGLLFSGIVASGEFPVSLYDLKTREQRVLLPDGVGTRYVPTGHLVYEQRGTLMAAPFNLGKTELAGAAVPVVEGVMQSTTAGAPFSISNNGSLAYIPGGARGPQTALVWVDRKGTEQPIGAPASSTYASPRISPDGRRVAVLNQGQVWIYDLTRGTLSPLTSEPTLTGNNSWTPDGKRIVFQSGTPLNLFWQPSDGSGKAERLSTNQYRQGPGSWSPDGNTLAFVETNPKTGQDIWVLRLSDNKSEPFLQTQFNEGGPQFSPDGGWLAYASDESGHWEIYVRPYPGPGGKLPISTEGGKEPLWNRNAKELFYRNGDKMMAVGVTMQPTFSAGKPELLFERHYRPTNASLPQYDVSPDGQRFLMMKEVGEDPSASQINIVQNWFEELKQKVPTGKK
jgi:serine/threonine-protein kinase